MGERSLQTAECCLGTVSAPLVIVSFVCCHTVTQYSWSLRPRTLIRQRTLLAREQGSEAPRVLSHRMTADEAYDHEECQRGAATAPSGL